MARSVTLTRPVHSRFTDDRLDRWAFPVFVALLIALSVVHAIYLWQTKYPFTSPDEAHYSRGAVSIATGLRTGTLSGAWAGYLAALGFKPPLICIPAAFFMLFTKSVTLPFSLTLVLTFAALGVASYSLFRNCFPPFQAAMAAITLLCMPMVTGLTHRYYTENLVLLFTVVTIDLLLRVGWRSSWGSLLIGIVFGLGILAKTTFLLFILPPIAVSLWIDVRQRGARSAARNSIAPVVKIGCALLIGLAVAWSWYWKNLAPTLEHARISASAAKCFYGHWIAADLSSGPSILVTIFAAIGIPVLVRRIALRSETGRALHAWIMILLLGVTTAAGICVSVNKATRFQVTWLPAFAALAVAAWYALGGAWVRIGPAVVAACAIVLSLHNSFEILPVPTVAWGDVKLIDSRFPLNVPGWFDDNAPVDRRDYRLSEVESRIAADASRRFPTYSAEARTTQSQLLFNFYYFDFLSAARNHPEHYMTFLLHSWTAGPRAADYLIYTKRFEQFYPGTENEEYYPQIEEDVTVHRIPYRELFRINGPENSQIVVLVKK